ncbi:uncharacterized protein G2W53_039404 [Senna tora]|uniref:Uncharacterized protein n=1 Tax=Senna tora TaxID=362788 RepID=A0A834W3J3_9FABA|nr:uncharacterized protein G2W53_039404 [Senna tora]
MQKFEPLRYEHECTFAATMECWNQDRCRLSMCDPYGISMVPIFRRNQAPVAAALKDFGGGVERVLPSHHLGKEPTGEEPSKEAKKDAPLLEIDDLPFSVMIESVLSLEWYDQFQEAALCDGLPYSFKLAAKLLFEALLGLHGVTTTLILPRGNSFYFALRFHCRDLAGPSNVKEELASPVGLPPGFSSLVDRGGKDNVNNENGDSSPNL